MTNPNRVVALAKAVTNVLQLAGFSPDTLLKGQIVHTDLPWQAPPLRSTATLAGLPMSAYLDYPVKVEPEAFYNFYCEGLAKLSQDPTGAVGGGGWRGLTAAVPRLPTGDRLLRFAIPAGFPEQVDVFAGHRFALEAAHFASVSWGTQVESLGSSNTFLCETEFGPVGIVEGLPTAYSDLWDLSCEGQLDEMLTLPRGLLNTSCHYDILAKVRSVLYENVEKFEEFEGLDIALQALRVLTNGRLCTELLQSVEGMSRAAFYRKRKIKILEECIETMASWSLNDRTKISTLFERLVPEVMNMSEYQRKIIDPYRVLPAVLALKTENRILWSLKQMKEKLENAK